MRAFFHSISWWLLGAAIGYSAFVFTSRFISARTPHGSLAHKLSLSLNRTQKATPSHALQLPFTEDVVAELESSWETLPSQAEVLEESRGWRILRLDPNSPLGRAGYHKGDLIPSEKIDASLAALKGHDNALAQRIFKVLKRLSN
jgi:hypothetical protein